MDKRILLINGPPRSGKSTAAKLLADTFKNTEVIGFSYHLKRMVHGIYLGAKGFAMDPDVFDDCKSEPQKLLGGMSWRQAYIHYSEAVIKPLHGNQWFGEMFIRSAEASPADLIIVPDSGFSAEAAVVVRRFGCNNVRLIRMHRLGCTFTGDSRGYIDLKDFGMSADDIQNFEGSLDLTLCLLLNSALKLRGRDLLDGP